MKIALTIDVEEWFHPIRFYRPTRDIESARLRIGLEILRDQLSVSQTRATFYWVGELARRYGAQLRALTAEGHEIGCHSLRHDRFIYDMSPAEFCADTKRARQELEDAAGIAVRTYRAPCFSITRRSLWALDVLEQLGFETDSSIFPARSWRYGIADFPRTPTLVGTALLEVPLPVVSVARMTLPATGGAYFRIYPYWMSRHLLRRVERREGGGVFYLHPWELDPRHPRVPFHPLAGATHYWRLGRTRSRLERLLRDFRFTTIRDFSDQHRRRQPDSFLASSSEAPRRRAAR